MWLNRNPDSTGIPSKPGAFPIFISLTVDYLINNRVILHLCYELSLWVFVSSSHDNISIFYESRSIPWVFKIVDQRFVLLYCIISSSLWSHKLPSLLPRFQTTTCYSSFKFHIAILILLHWRYFCSDLHWTICSDKLSMQPVFFF